MLSGVCSLQGSTAKYILVQHIFAEPLFRCLGYKRHCYLPFIKVTRLFQCKEVCNLYPRLFPGTVLSNECSYRTAFIALLFLMKHGSTITGTAMESSHFWGHTFLRTPCLTPLSSTKVRFGVPPKMQPVCKILLLR